MDLTIGLAFLGGLASFMSPCVLSMVPIYVGYIGGYSFSNQNQNNSLKFRPVVLLHGVMFVVGFSLVFIIMGITISALGGYLVLMRVWLARVSGVIIIIFGVHMVGIFSIKWLEYEIKIQPNQTQYNNLAASLGLGVIFAAGWTPCIGPILGSILALTINSESIHSGFIYLLFYSLGMAIPFLLVCLTIESASIFIRKYHKIAVFSEKIMGALLIIVGLLLISGIYDIFFQAI